jgi:uncharacterized protein (TIGR02391 family)
MDTRLLKILKEQIEKIESLKSVGAWGPQYDIWKNTTYRIVRDLFGDDYLKLIERNETRVFSMGNSAANQRRYLEELDSMKSFLESSIQEFERLESDSALSIGRSIGLTDYDLHQRIKEVVDTKYEDGHYADAVEAGFKEVIKRVKDYVNSKTGGNLDGAKAIGRAFDFDRQEPLIKFNNLQSDEEKDEQRGIAFLFKGIVCIRNRKVHENIVLSNPYRALEYLALASLLMRLLDEYAK